jgi:hypothetical protein
MTVTLAVDEGLLDSAFELGGLKTKPDTVNAALEEFIKRKKRQGAMSLKGTIDFDTNWSPKAARGK